MNREINFRVCHKPSATMHNYLKAKFGPAGINITLSGKFKDVEEPTTLTVPNTDLEVMQSTGIKDKRGPPIFEGDVVEYEKQDLVIGVKKRVVIEWDKCRVEASSPDSRIGFYIPEARELMEVIGNVYENPELLTGVGKPLGIESGV